MLGLAAAASFRAGNMPAQAEEWRVSPYARLIWIGVDGVGTFFRDTDTPNFDRIFQNGKITWNCIAPEPTVSAPGWCSMFYGVPFSVHGVTNEMVEVQPFNSGPLKSVFRQTSDAYPGEAVGVFCTWHAIGSGMLDVRPEDAEVTIYPAARTSANSEQTLAAAVSWLQEQSDFKLLFFYLEDPDNAGHAYGYGSPGHRAAISRVDGLIGAFYDELEERGFLEDALILLSTDHGGTPEGTHGGGSAAESHCVFAVQGEGLNPNTEIGSMELKDIAAVVRYALGLEQPDFSDAAVPEGLFAPLN